MEEPQSSPPTNTNQSQGNLKAALTYAAGWLTGLIFLLTEKDDQFIRFHAAQSTVLFGSLMILSFIPVLQLLMIFIGPVALVLWIVLMIKAYKNEKFELPLVSDWAKKLEPQLK